MGVGIYALKDTPAWLVEHFPNHDRSLLVGYTHLTEAQIASGMARVAQALKA
jgi:GntR family transcriptional regulator/MocR family aminotransferase